MIATALATTIFDPDDDQKVDVFEPHVSEMGGTRALHFFRHACARQANGDRSAPFHRQELKNRGTRNVVVRLKTLAAQHRVRPLAECAQCVLIGYQRVLPSTVASPFSGPAVLEFYCCALKPGRRVSIADLNRIGT